MSWPEACMLAASRLTSASAFCPDKLVNIEHHRQVMLKVHISGSCGIQTVSWLPLGLCLCVHRTAVS